MDQAAVFLAGSILTGLGFIAIMASIVVVNNMLAKYWKPVQWTIIPEAIRSMPPTRFAEPHELTETKEAKLDLSKNR